ncbi:MAG TPA: cytochrome P450 [Candidatus Binataceae bacterium]|nr:cytochrome P450 [Candidatus Binataceae bacterium]
MAKARLVIDFDHHSKQYASRVFDDPTGFFQQMHREHPVAWTEKHGGFWVISRYEDVKRVSEDDATFSSRNDLPTAGEAFSGITIPGNRARSTPIEMDPPEFFDYRRLLNRWFAPAAVERLKPKVLEFTSWCLDRHIESGKIDLVLDLASPVPAMMTLHVLGIPLQHWHLYADTSHAVVYTPPDSPSKRKALEGDMMMRGTFVEVIKERRRKPGDDIISHLINARIDGHPIPDPTLIEICSLIVHGGVDTTTSLLANTFEYLERTPADRKRLIDDPSLIFCAGEEFLRYYCPVQMLARTATRDVELCGQRIRAGERIGLWWAAANHDAAAFEHPEKIILDRFPNRHSAFGLGIHRCLGSNFARAQYAIVLEEVLRRMPDYRLIRDRAEHYESIGTVNGYVKMPAAFTPAKRRGTPVEIAPLQ